MSPIITTKRFILKALLAANGTPMPQPALEDFCRAVQPALLMSDFNQSLREIEADQFALATRDELDGGVSWALTTKGMLRAKQL